MEDISDADYAHSKKDEDSEIKNVDNIMICIFKAIHYC